MVKRKIIWSARAKNERISILDFYYKRNGNIIYSRKLNTKFSNAVKLLFKYPAIGVKTDIKNVRAFIEGDYIFFYRINKNTIEIISLWDSRQNPGRLNLG